MISSPKNHSTNNSNVNSVEDQNLSIGSIDSIVALSNCSKPSFFKTARPQLLDYVLNKMDRGEAIGSTQITVTSEAADTYPILFFGQDESENESWCIRHPDGEIEVKVYFLWDCQVEELSYVAKLSFKYQFILIFCGMVVQGFLSLEKKNEMQKLINEVLQIQDVFLQEDSDYTEISESHSSFSP